MEFVAYLQNEVQGLLMTLAAIGSFSYLGYKKILKHGNKEDLDSAKAKAEKGVIDLIYVRLQELDKTNRALVEEVEALRRENLVARIQNEEMRKEIHQLKKFIEMNFSPTFDNGTLR